METSVIVWQCITIFCYILQPVCTTTTHTSKACYGSEYLCVRHGINCSSNQKIAIYDAYYTNNTECGQGLSSCALVNPDNVKEHGYHRFNNTELVSLYSNCSTETRCVYRAPRRDAALTFSVVKYKCIESATKTSKACYGAPGPSCTRHDIGCNNTQKIAICDAYYTDNTECRLTGLSSCATVNPDNVTEHGHHRFDNTELVSLYNNCSTETRCVYRAPAWRSAVLAFSVVKYQCVKTSDPFKVTCEPVTSAGGLTTGSTEYSSTISPSSQFPVGLFVGGMAVGAVIVILVGLAVYVLVVRRRYDLTPKKQGDTPASIEHPTYSGLSAGAAVNNYDIIEQTSRFQGDTTHEVEATPDYQNV